MDVVMGEMKRVKKRIQNEQRAHKKLYTNLNRLISLGKVGLASEQNTRNQTPFHCRLKRSGRCQAP